jgi:transposase
MLDLEDYIVIKTLKKRGVYIKDIAEELGVHPKTVSRALKREGAPQKKRKRRPGKLEPYKPTVDRLLQEGVWNAMVILREIQAEGYPGGITMLRQYMAPKRAMRPGKATVRFETRPGQQLQTDWGELVVVIAGEETRVFFIVNQLAYSRRFHFWCTDSLDAEHTYEGLVRSLEYFEGVPEEVLVDNQKSAVLEHPRSGQVRFNERFLDLAQCYGWAHLNQQAEQWLATEADQRVHGTVKEVVVLRFEREQPTLQPLPTQRYDTSYRETRHVAWDAYIDVRGNRYSVPDTLVNQVVVVRIGLDDRLRVFHQDQLVTTHALRSAQQGWVTTPEHHARLWKEALHVERRSLQAYEEAAQWN